MKRTILISGLLCFIFCLNAQITLEHTFKTKGTSISTTTGAILSSYSSYSSGDVQLYHFDKGNNKLTLYKSDFSVYKSVDISIPSGLENPTLHLISDKLFNDDDAIEFIISVYKFEVKDGATIMIPSLRLFNENGMLLKDFGNRYYPQIFQSNGKLKILIYTSFADENGDYFTDIYSLPGNLDIVSTSRSSVEPAYAYPNPAKTVVNLPYTLENGQTTMMNILNSNGQLIETKIIDSNFGQILLNVSSYRPGIYIYEYNGISNRFVVN